MVHRLHDEMWQQEFFTSCQLCEYFRIIVSLWIDRMVSRADDMSQVDDGRWKPIQASLLKQISLDRRLLHAIFGEQIRVYVGYCKLVSRKRLARQVFGNGVLRWITVYPECPTVLEVLNATAQGINKVPSAGLGKAHHIDHHISGQRCNLIPEGTVLLLLIAVERDGLNPIPRGMRQIRLAATACDIDDFVPGLN